MTRRDVVHAACHLTGLTINQFLSHGSGMQTLKIVNMRKACMRILHYRLGLSLAHTGRILNRDRTTVLTNLRRPQTPAILEAEQKILDHVGKVRAPTVAAQIKPVRNVVQIVPGKKIAPFPPGADVELRRGVSIQELRRRHPEWVL